jgi:hypothetical protein
MMPTLPLSRQRLRMWIPLLTLRPRPSLQMPAHRQRTAWLMQALPPPPRCRLMIQMASAQVLLAPAAAWLAEVVQRRV